jgi:hypothetical protein
MDVTSFPQSRWSKGPQIAFGFLKTCESDCQSIKNCFTDGLVTQFLLERSPNVEATKETATAIHAGAAKETAAATQVETTEWETAAAVQVEAAGEKTVAAIHVHATKGKAAATQVETAQEGTTGAIQVEATIEGTT